MENLGWRVLLVDDDVEDYLITKDLLSEARGRKIDLVWAASYKDGQEMLAQETFDAILVDYDLGFHKGTELIREMCACGCPSPAILYTGRGSYEIDLEAMNAGATLYVAKGEVNPLMLERSIRYAIEIKQKERSLRESEARERAKAAELNAILDAVPALVCVTHDRLASEMSGNQAANEVLRVPVGGNFSPSSPDGPHHFDLFHEGRKLTPEEMPMHISASTGKSLRNYEEEVVFNNGDRVHLFGNVTPLLDEEGLPAGAVAAFIDLTQQKRVQDEIRLQQDLLGRLLESAPVGIAFLKGPQHVYTLVNQEYKGYSRDKGELVGRTVAEVWPDIGPVVIPQLDHVFQTGEPITVKDAPLTIMRESGPENNFFNYTFVPIYNTGGVIEGVMILATDTTQAVLARRAIEAQSAEIEAVLEALPVGVWIYDADGQLVSKNRQADAIWAGGADIPPGGSIEYNAWCSGSGKPLSPSEFPVIHALRTGQVAPQVEMRIQRLDGTTGHVLAIGAPIKGGDGSVVGGVAINLDISRRKQTEEALLANILALRESEERFKRAILVAPYPLMIRREDGRVLMVNEAWTRLSGYSLEHIPTIDAWTRRAYGERASSMRQIIARAYQGGDLKQYWGEYEINTLNGDRRIWDFSTADLGCDPEGRKLVLSMAVDMTERNRAEVIQQNYLEQVKVSNRELEDFAFIASHDLKEPLRKINMFAEMLRKQLAGQPGVEGADYIDRIQNASTRMQSMVNGLLELSKVQTRGGQFVPINLNQTVKEVVSDLEVRLDFEKGQVVIADLPDVVGDAGQIRRLFQNLIGNAIKFHRSGVPPVISITGEVVKEGIERRAVIRVSDNGIGLDEEESTQIFQPFTRMKGRSDFEGSGLGLAICRRIVERHLGTIEVLGKPGEGSTFIVTLPLPLE